MRRRHPRALLCVGHTFFAPAVTGDMRQQAKDFYRRFCQVERSDEQRDRLATLRNELPGAAA